MNLHRKNAPFWMQTIYAFRSVWNDISQKKIGTFLTILVISVSITIPVAGYLLWKNTHQAANQIYPETELTVYLNKNLTETDTIELVEAIRGQEGVEAINYISRQESLNQFRSWSGFNDELDILEENPLPAVVIISPTNEFLEPQNLAKLRQSLIATPNVEEVRFDDGWAEKLSALTWFMAQIAIFCAILMVIAVILVIGNSIRSDIYSSRNTIEIMKLLGATDKFIARPFLYTGFLFGLLGSALAVLFSTLLVSYFSNGFKYVADIFAIKMTINGLIWQEILFLLVSCSVIGYISALIAIYRHIKVIHYQ